MLVNFLVSLIFCILVTPVHLIGLILLFKRADSNIYGTQKYLILSLSLTEISFLTLSATRDFIWYIRNYCEISGLLLGNYMTIVSSNMYYFTMFAITIDRFLEIRLNIKYSLYWKPKSTKNILFIVFTTLNVAYISYLIIVLIFKCYETPRKVLRAYYNYVTPLLDSTFVTTASIVYCYIFARIYKNRKISQRLRKNINGPKQKSKSAKTRVPFWIVVTFILFLIVPDILYFIYMTYHLRSEFYVFILILYRLGYLADPIIYIYNLKVIKRYISCFRATVLSHVNIPTIRT